MANTQPTPPSHVSIWNDSTPNQSPRLVIVSIIFFVLSTLVVTVRSAWRWTRHQQRGWDDVMALLAYLVLLIMTTFAFLAADYGFGKPSAYITATLPKALQYFYLYQIFYRLLCGLTQLTFCFLYLRTFSSQTLRRIIIVTAVIIAAGSLAFTVATIFQCTPVDKAWDRSVDRVCTSNLSFWYSHAGFSMLINLVLFTLPISMISTLDLVRGQKSGLMAIFFVGSLVIIASIIRMVALRPSVKSNDITWDALDPFMWTEIESSLSVICCSMPALRTPFIRLWDSAFSSSNSQKASAGPTAVSEKPHRFQDGAWAGPHQSSAFVMGGMPLRPADCYYSSSVSSSGGTSKNTSIWNGSSGGVGGGGGGRAGKWYGRALKSVGKDKSATHSRSSSQEILARPRGSEDDVDADAIAVDTDGVPIVMELGAIYKTTDLQVTTSEVGEASGAIDRQAIESCRFMRKD